MNSTERLDMLKKVRQFILANPKASFTEVVEELKTPELSTTQFYNIRAQLRKKGKLMDRTVEPNAATGGHAGAAKSTHIEILETIDIADFSQDLKEHYKERILPLLRRLVPGGKNIRLAFLSDPPSIEIQREVL